MGNKYYIKKFNSQSDYESQKDSVMATPHVVLLNDTKEVVYASESNETPSDPFNGHDYVDLGLPSGILWAKSNVGAESEEDYGLYFTWGSTIGATQEEIENQTFTFGPNGNAVKYITSDGTITKYNSTDGKTVLDLEDDAAHVYMGGDWHMPTKEQLEELIANTTLTWIVQDEVIRQLFTSKTNGNSLFIPAAGGASDNGIEALKWFCFVWSASVNSSICDNAWALSLYEYQTVMDDGLRVGGFSVRGVVG